LEEEVTFEEASSALQLQLLKPQTFAAASSQLTAIRYRQSSTSHLQSADNVSHEQAY
jgi:hypothetical protein